MFYQNADFFFKDKHLLASAFTGKSCLFLWNQKLSTENKFKHLSLPTDPDLTFHKEHSIISGAYYTHQG